MSDSSVTTRWEGYSDYQSVSRRIAESIQQATEAYATIQRAHAEQARVDPDLAARAGARILSPALLLRHHMEEDREAVDEYQEILDRWTGGDGDTGMLDDFRQVELTRECPDWLFQFVQDMNTAGVELGYLAAGRSQKQEEAIDEIDEATREMFET